MTKSGARCSASTQLESIDQMEEVQRTLEDQGVDHTVFMDTDAEGQRVTTGIVTNMHEWELTRDARIEHKLPTYDSKEA
jgi:5S rRNA maturation endonuclease (ribonuclease M5)